MTIFFCISGKCLCLMCVLLLTVNAIRYELNPMYDCVHHDNIDSKNSLALYGTYPFKFSLILNF